MGLACSSTTLDPASRDGEPFGQPINMRARSATCCGQQAARASTNISATSSSQPSRMEKVPSCSVGEAEVVVTATAVPLSELQGELDTWVRQRRDASDREAFATTLQRCSEVLTNGIGGAIIVVLHEEIIRQKLLDFTCLDNGVLHTAMQSMVTNVNVEPDAFKAVLDILSSHTDSDRWEQENLVDLVNALPAAEKAANSISSLAGQPKDGAILISHLGEIHGATLQLKATGSKKAILQKADGTAAGTRHNSSLSLASWLSEDANIMKLDLQSPGVVFTRSDAGGAHAFIPQPNGAAPAVLHFETIHHLTQVEMLKIFREKIMRQGLLMRKKVPALGRLGVLGEHVVTVVGGRKTSETTIQGEQTHMVLRAATPDQEHYVLPMEKFRKLYMEQGIELDDLEGALSSGPFLLEQMRQLMLRGYKLYEPRPDNRRYIYKLQKEDMQLIKTSAFISAWKCVQPVRETDYLACPEDASEIYLMPEEVVKSGYAECRSSNGHHHSMLQRRDSNGVKVWSQEEMLDKYAKQVQEKGSLMVKFGTVLMRQAKRHESVVTCIHGRVVASVLVTDEDSKVVQGDLHELYVLSKAKVEENYESSVQEIDGNGPLDVLLKSQGFKRYTPKKKPKWFYKVQSEDVETMPKAFLTAFGSVQLAEAGDYLVIPQSECDGMREIYVMSEDKTLSYRPINIGSGEPKKNLPSRFIDLTSLGNMLKKNAL